jgi:site-specific DNA recombinase
LRTITDAGVRVFTYLRDRECVLDSATDKVMLALTNFGAELEREKASQRVHDAHASRARRGVVAGGAVFGYANVRNGDGFVHRVIVPDEAAVIRRIFESAASGVGYARIAKMLNEEHAPAPRSRGSWSVSGVRDVLRRDLYRGLAVWGREHKRVRGGRERRQARPASEWITTEAPVLAIVSPELWTAARGRIAATSARRWTPRAPDTSARSIP